jgi:hypothetical protein
MIRPFKPPLEREVTFKGLPYSSKGPKEVIVLDLRLARGRDVHKALSPPPKRSALFFFRLALSGKEANGSQGSQQEAYYIEDPFKRSSDCKLPVPSGRLFPNPLKGPSGSVVASGGPANRRRARLYHRDRRWPGSVPPAPSGGEASSKMRDGSGRSREPGGLQPF